MTKAEEKKIQQLREEAEEVADTLEGKVAKAGKNARIFFVNARRRAAAESDNMRKRIKTRPLTSAAIAFGAGVVVASILRRK